MISEKKKENQSVVMSWMRTRISFSLIKSCVLCLRGTRDPKERREKGFGSSFEERDDGQGVDYEIARAETRGFL